MSTSPSTQTKTSPITTPPTVVFGKDPTETLQGCVSEFFKTLPQVAYLTAAGAISSYLFTVIPPLGGAILLGSFGTVALITVLACRLLLDSSYEFAIVAGIVAGLFLVNSVAQFTFPVLGYPLLSRAKITLFTGATALGTLLFVKLFSKAS